MSQLQKKVNETGLSELMTVIRRNSQESPCIENFEVLLNEINHPEFVNAVVNDMFKFITEAFELFKSVDRVPQKRFKAKMLSQEFIQPMRFFGRTRQLADESMRVRAALELIEKEQSKLTVDTNRVPVKVSYDDAAKILNDFYECHMTFKEIHQKYHGNALQDPEVVRFIQEGRDAKELARREMLLWNYIPAVVKAIIQTKRRSLDMDKNSKRFK